MGAYTSRIAWEPLRSIDSATLTGSYQALGTPLVNPSYILKLVNNSTKLVTISINGSTDIDVAPANSFWLYDEGKMMPGIAPCLSLPLGTQIFVKGAAGTGSIYLVSQYIVNI
jgi:hypothetical protein